MYTTIADLSRESILSYFKPVRCVRALSLCLLMGSVAVMATGCGPKSIQYTDPFIATDEGKTSQADASFKLIDDGGKPLSPAEKNALMSVGAFDKNLSAKDMYDVMRHFKRYVHKERITIETGIKNSQNYLSYMRQAMRQKNVPEEMVYLAFVESLYRPKARSQTGALGIWQFISSTGKAYGMRQDYWADERYDVRQSTRAAATYLSKLNNRFDDWHLAVASYNAGQGKIGRGLKATGTKTFFDLRRKNNKLKGTKNYLTEENQQYLPKFLAVCKIMRNLESLGFDPLRPSSSRALTAIAVRPGTDLRALARTSGISWSRFVAANPAYKRAVSPPTRRTTAYVPASSVQRAKGYLAQARKRTTEGFKVYTVASGDSMSRIARKYGMPTSALRRLNPKSEPLKVGTALALPRTLAEASGARGKGLAPTRKAYAQKTTIVKPVHKVQTKRQIAQKRPVKGQPSITYVVKAKDTIWGIARKFNVSPHGIMQLNRLNRQSIIRSGDVLQVATK